MFFKYVFTKMFSSLTGNDPKQYTQRINKISSLIVTTGVFVLYIVMACVLKTHKNNSWAATLGF